jgi:hypothetical protein
MIKGEIRAEKEVLPHAFDKLCGHSVTPDMLIMGA